MKTKRLQKIESFGIEFDEEEIEKLGWEENQKLFVECLEDGSISISKGAEIEIDFSEFSNETLVGMIQQMNEADMTFEDYVREALTEIIKNSD